MSEQVFVESRPFLEILANNVFCTHGSVVSGLNSNEAYYLASRGLDTQTTRKLLIHGFIDELLTKMQALSVDKKHYQEIIGKIKLNVGCW